MDMEIDQKPKGQLLSPLIIAIIIGAWIIGISIVISGWLITKQLAKNNEPAPVLPVNIDVPAGLPVLGNNNAKVTIVEFADFQCPYCGEWHKDVLPQLKSQYLDTGKARFVFMDFPFLGEESVKAAEAARCAMDQNKFWEYHDKLFVSQAGENAGAFADIKLKQFAKDIELDSAKFNSCLDARIYKSQVDESLQQGTGYGVISTPTIFINGIMVEGIASFQSYQQIIESELAK